MTFELDHMSPFHSPGIDGRESVHCSTIGKEDITKFSPSYIHIPVLKHDTSKTRESCTIDSKGDIPGRERIFMTIDSKEFYLQVCNYAFYCYC